MRLHQLAQHAGHLMRVVGAGVVARKGENKENNHGLPGATARNYMLIRAPGIIFCFHIVGRCGW